MALEFSLEVTEVSENKGVDFVTSLLINPFNACRITTGAWALCIINSLDTDVLVAQGSKASTAMVLTQYSRNIPVSGPEVLRKL